MTPVLFINTDDDEVRFVLDQHAELDFYSASSLKRQSAGRHVAPLGHIIPIASQPVFALSPNIRSTGRYILHIQVQRPVGSESG
jgi:hypothetical protein